MSFWIVVSGTVAMACLGYMLFMLTIFTGGGLANGGAGADQIRWLDRAIFGLPAICALAAALVWLFYALDGSPLHYAWWALPVPPVLAYLNYAFNTKSSK